MEDLAARIIAALRKAAQNARNADEAGEPTALADALEAAPLAGAVVIPASVPVVAPEDVDVIKQAADPQPAPEPAAEPPADPVRAKKANRS